jgi:CRISPR-associated protein Cmr4
MKAQFYTLTAQTNIHAGSGDTDYGVIDKLIQRDALDKLPCVYSQSIKGCIREHFDGLIPNDKFGYMDTIFGKSNKKGGKTNVKEGEGKSGEFVFLQANLLSLPIRCNNRAFYRVTSVAVLKELYDLLVGVNCKSSIVSTLEKVSKITLTSKQAYFSEGKSTLEDLDDLVHTPSVFETHKADLEKLLGKPFAIVSDETLRELSDNLSLPVIARNCLENGQSTNLWYEQILPRQTKFSFIVLKPDVLDATIDTFFETTLQASPIQIGANASIGYGLSHFEKQG